MGLENREKPSELRLEGSVTQNRKLGPVIWHLYLSIIDCCCCWYDSVLWVMSSSLFKMNQRRVDAEAGCYISHDAPANNPLVLFGYGTKAGWQVQSMCKLLPVAHSCRRALLNVAKHSDAWYVAAANIVLHKHRSAKLLQFHAAISCFIWRLPPFVRGESQSSHIRKGLGYPFN